MSLETATYINGLVATNPLGSDPLADADGHLRLIKSTLKTTFPNITGAVTITQAQLNSPFPAGGIIMWSGSTGSIPSGWYLCNGSNGTPDLRNRFIIGAGSTFAVGATGGSATISVANLPAHNHTATTSTAGSHVHGIDDPGHTHTYSTAYRKDLSSGGDPNNVWGNVGQPDSTLSTGGSTTGISVAAAGDHTHTITVANTGSGTAYYPPYYALAFIMKAAY